MFRRPFDRYAYRTPWREMERLQREMNRMFADSFSLAGGRTAPQYPAINVWTNEDGAVLTASAVLRSPTNFRKARNTIGASAIMVISTVPSSFRSMLKPIRLRLYLKKACCISRCPAPKWINPRKLRLNQPEASHLKGAALTMALL